MRDELVDKVLASSLAKASIRKRKFEVKPVLANENVEKISDTGEFILVIASSTGWIQALRGLIPYLPANFHIPGLVVQHMPPLFTDSLASSLNDC